MNELLTIAAAKLMDWPTVGLGLAGGLLATSWVGVVPITLIVALLVELVLMQVRGWALNLTLLAVGAVAALPWVGIGFALRRLARRVRR
jgi:hypothetical protein